MNLSNFCNHLALALGAITVEPSGFERVIGLAKAVRNAGAKVIFVGNGGSAAIASHMAIDWLNKGHFGTMCLNDGAALTCIGNDYGYENVFRYQLKHNARVGDLLFAISSSGRSKNIIDAATYVGGFDVVTLSGFEQDNPLRKLGGVNFHVPSRSYPIVENVHMAILHALLEAVR